MDLRIQRRPVVIGVQTTKYLGALRRIFELSRTRIVVLTLITLGGLWLRLYLLGAESLWLDESTSLVVARKEPIEILRWLVGSDAHPPAYFLLLHYWLALGDSEFVLRLLPALIGTISVPAIYHLGAQLFDTETALYSAFLLAISPAHIQFSQDSRSHALLILFGILSSYMLFKSLRRGMARYWIGYAIVALLGMYTHYFFVFVLLAHNLFVLITFVVPLRTTLLDVRLPNRLPWQVKSRGTPPNPLSGGAVVPHRTTLLGTRLSNSTPGQGGCVATPLSHRPGGVLDSGNWVRLRWWLLAEGVIIVGFMPLLWAWWVSLAQDISSASRFTEQPVGLKHLVMTFMDFGIGTTVRERSIRFFGYTVLAFLAIYPLWQVFIVSSRSARLRRWGSSIGGERRFLAVLYCLAYMMVPVLGIFALSQIKFPYLFRYLVQGLPGFLLILALGVRCVGRRQLKALFILAITVVTSFSLASYYSEDLNDDWRGAAAYLVSRAQPGDVVLFNPSWNFKPFAYYSANAVDLYPDLPLSMDQDNVEEVLKPVIADRRRLWLVRSPEFSFDRNGEIPDYLSARFVELDKAWFRGVGDVVLYDLRRSIPTSQLPETRSAERGKPARRVA